MCFDEVPGRLEEVGLEEKPCSVGGDAMGVDVEDIGLEGRLGRKPGTTGDSGNSASWGARGGLSGKRSIFSVGLSSLSSSGAGDCCRSGARGMGLKASSGLKRLFCLLLICRLGTTREGSERSASVVDSIETLEEAETGGLISDWKLCVDEDEEAESEGA